MNAKKAKALRRAVRGFGELVGLKPETIFTTDAHGTVVTQARCLRGYYRRAKRDPS